jgi:hypothetical protein
MYQPKIYKYLLRQFAELLTEKGSIRIGTFGGFRAMEGFDPERGDENEGKLIKSMILEKDTPHTEWPQEMFTNIAIEGAPLIGKHGAKVSLTTDLPDIFMYCCSMKHDCELMKSFGADSCVEIFDIQNFGDAISAKMTELNHGYQFFLAEPCNYSGHEIPFGRKAASHFLKDEKFKHQEEFRFLFFPLTYEANGELHKAQLIERPDGGKTFRVYRPYPPITPVNIVVPELSKYCRINNPA